MTTTYTARALALTLSGAAVAAALVGVGGTGAQAEAAGKAGLGWGPCVQDEGPRDQECGELEVPVDYREPGGRQIRVGVSRLPSERGAEKRGTLLVIAGGPGSSGVQRLAQKGEALRGELGGAYDIVSIDPRGVGRSTTAGCRLADEDRDLVNLRAWPGTDGDLTGTAARSRRIAEACERHGGEVLKSFSSANQVRDIERFRQALGVERLSAWGISYGTYVGAAYAQKYPHRTDRWVLDTNGDPDPRRVARGWLANTGAAVEGRFADFARWAADPARESEGLRLAERAEDVRPLVIELAARLDRTPKKTTTPGVPLTGNRLRQSLQSYLYSDRLFDELARLIREAGHPKGAPELPGELAKPVSDESAAVTMAVVCNDVRWPGKLSTYERAVAADRVRHPLTAGLSGAMLPCAFWKAPAEKPVRITDDGPSNILMIQNRRDPSTPHFGALKMREALGERARLVTVERGGHGAYLGEGNACGNRKVTGFLLTGQRPEKDISCEG
ncbi:alpha/beta hydrolase [Streptomyces jumonjinensis]|uniref:alpha/beta hydrolase n=1 Tax=Streptomyces jumonjinensis TaxID=1945 RepID=UPI0037B6DC5F